MIGHGVAAMNMSTCMPKPNVKVSRSRTVIWRSAATVSSSGPSILRSTRGEANSGSSRVTGSSSVNSPASASAIVTAPVIGFVVDAMRNSESRCTGGPSIDSEPSVSTCTSVPEDTRATRPGIRSGPMCARATSASRWTPAADNPLIPFLLFAPSR
jgi:hypothetical protein